MKPGAGPRGLVFSPPGTHAYLVNELDSTVTAYRYYPAEGRLEELQTLSTLPEGFSGASSCAEMQISPSGEWLYASNRGHNSLAIFAVDRADGRLARVGHESTRGRIPRHFTVDSSGEWLLAANQDTNNLVVFRVDGASGKLTGGGPD